MTKELPNSDVNGPNSDVNGDVDGNFSGAIPIKSDAGYRISAVSCDNSCLLLEFIFLCGNLWHNLSSFCIWFTFFTLF